jgi:serine/threonine-protein kinase HipA
MTYEVHLHDVLVGHIRASEDGHSRFDFTSSYLNLPERPVLGQHFEDDLNKTYRGKRYRLPAFFANLVPEGNLRALIENTFDLPEGDDLALLSAVQRDLPGAVRIRPLDSRNSHSAWASSTDTGTTSTGDEETDEPEGLRFSLAGVQMKFSVLNQEETITLPGRDEFGRWIVKLDSPSYSNLTENEYSMLEWARAAGFTVPETKLLPASRLPERVRAHAPADSQVLLIERYDRDATGRIHQEDFNQVVGQAPKYKYDQIKYEDIAVLSRSIVGAEAFDEVIRRLVLMVATGNSDAHLKNWSLYYPDRISAELTPLYDQVATIAWQDHGLNQNWALKLAGVKDPFQTRMSTFERLAEKTDADPHSVTSIVEETLSRIAECWRKSPAPDRLPQGHVSNLQDFWNRVPLLEDYASALNA